MHTWTTKHHGAIFAFADLMSRWFIDLIRHDFSNLLTIRTSAFKETDGAGVVNEDYFEGFVKSHLSTCLKFFNSTIDCGSSDGKCRDDGAVSNATRYCSINKAEIPLTFRLTKVDTSRDKKTFNL